MQMRQQDTCPKLSAIQASIRLYDKETFKLPPQYGQALGNMKTNRLLIVRLAVLVHRFLRQGFCGPNMLVCDRCYRAKIDQTCLIEAVNKYGKYPSRV